MRAVFTFVAALILLSGTASAVAADLVLNNAPVSVYFSPDGGAMNAIVQSIKGARKNVRVMSSMFRLAPVASALSAVQVRGVDVQVILDEEDGMRQPDLAYHVQGKGVAVFIDGAHGKKGHLHNKVFIIDEKRVITGSFNQHKKSEDSNGENLLVIDSPELAAKYLEAFAVHKAHAKLLKAGK